jgi:hypothetical protein
MYLQIQLKELKIEEYLLETLRRTWKYGFRVSNQPAQPRRIPSNEQRVDISRDFFLRIGPCGLAIPTPPPPPQLTLPLTLPMTQATIAGVC